MSQRLDDAAPHVFAVTTRGTINPLNMVAIIGLTLGAVFGVAGTLVTQSNLRNASWGLDALGLLLATSLLVLKFLKKGNEVAAGGFLVFAIGEAVMLSGTAVGLTGSMPAFAAGTGLMEA